jgi:hypothetical protein
MNLTQEQTNEAIVKLLKGKSAEIFTSLDHETGKCQVLMECREPAALVLMLSQIVESIAKRGLSYTIIRGAVEMGLDRKTWRKP